MKDHRWVIKTLLGACVVMTAAMGITMAKVEGDKKNDRQIR